MDARDDGLEVVGGKGRALVRMANAGFAILGGFHMTTAYRKLVADNDLELMVANLTEQDRKTFRTFAASQNIDNLAHQATMPKSNTQWT